MVRPARPRARDAGPVAAPRGADDLPVRGGARRRRPVRAPVRPPRRAGRRARRSSSSPARAKPAVPPAPGHASSRASTARRSPCACSRPSPSATARRPGSHDDRARGRRHPRAAAREPAVDAREAGRPARRSRPAPRPRAVLRPAQPRPRGPAGGGARCRPRRGRRRLARAPDRRARCTCRSTAARLADLPGHPPADAPLVCIDTETTGLATAAGTLAFLVGLARWEGDAFCQTQLLLPDHADEPALLAEIAAWITPDAWLVSYNGRGFDWPLIEARYRLAGRAAPRPRRPPRPAPVRAARVPPSDGGRAAAHRRGRAARRLAASATSRAGRSRGIYLDVLRGGPVDALAGVVIHNEKDVRSLGAAAGARRARVRRPGGAPRGAARATSPASPAPMAGRSATRTRSRAWTTPSARRRPFATRSGARRSAPAIARERLDEEREAWWTPRVQPTFGGRPPRAGWRGEHGERPRRAARTATGRRGWDTGGAWDAAARWTDERLAADRARVLRRLGRWSEAAEAWQTAAAAGGGLGVIAWIEVAKLREHRLADPAGALAATPGGLATPGPAAHDGPGRTRVSRPTSCAAAHGCRRGSAARARSARPSGPRSPSAAAAGRPRGSGRRPCPVPRR